MFSLCYIWHRFVSSFFCPIISHAQRTTVPYTMCNLIYTVVAYNMWWFLVIEHFEIDFMKLTCQNIIGILGASKQLQNANEKKHFRYINISLYSPHHYCIKIYSFWIILMGECYFDWNLICTEHKLTKINDFDLCIRGEENVVPFDVAMHDMIFVKMV